MSLGGGWQQPWKLKLGICIGRKQVKLLIGPESKLLVKGRNQHHLGSYEALRCGVLLAVCYIPVIFYAVSTVHTCSSLAPTAINKGDT